MPSDCQLDPPMHRRNPSGTSTPIVAGDSHRLSPQFMADPPDIDDTDPDVIPNQHGKSKSFPFYEGEENRKKFTRVLCCLCV